MFCAQAPNMEYKMSFHFFSAFKKIAFYLLNENMHSIIRRSQLNVWFQLKMQYLWLQINGKYIT